MKAIVNVSKSSGYSQYNGLTFDVVEVLNNIVCLSIPSRLDICRMDRIDFSFREVFIIDLQKEINNAKGNEKLFKCLNDYVSVNKIDIH
jgi:hypothetical protein